MGFSIYRLLSLGIFLIDWTGIGTSLRIVQKPQPVTISTEELNISCIADDPSYMTKSIFSIRIMRHIEDEPIAAINVGEKLKTAVGMKDNIKAKGHIDMKSKKGYLSLIVDKPLRQDAGTYRCQMFVMDENFQLVEKNVIGNVTYQDSDITGVVTHLTRQLTSLLTRFNKQNHTLHTLQKQHTAFKSFHSEQKLDMDILINKIDTQNITITQQNKQLEDFREFNTQQNLDLDNLTDEMDRQNNTDMKLTKQIENQNTEIKKQDTLFDKLTKQIENQNKQIKKQDTLFDKLTKQIENQNKQIKKHDEQNDEQIAKQTKQIERLTALVDKLNTDNTHKQQQLDTLQDYIQRHNQTIHELKALLDQGWSSYDADKTYIKVFGKGDPSKHLSWTKARESCQSFGGDLVVIRDAQKNNFVYNLFGGMSRWTWIGVRNHARRGFDFKYVDGSDMGSYHPWYRSNPDGDDKNDKCVYMTTNPSYPGRWGDYSCFYKTPYACSLSSTNIL